MELPTVGDIQALRGRVRIKPPIREFRGIQVVKTDRQFIAITVTPVMPDFCRADRAIAIIQNTCLNH